MARIRNDRYIQPVRATPTQPYHDAHSFMRMAKNLERAATRDKSCLPPRWWLPYYDVTVRRCCRGRNERASAPRCPHKGPASCRGAPRPEGCIHPTATTTLNTSSVRSISRPPKRRRTARAPARRSDTPLAIFTVSGRKYLCGAAGAAATHNRRRASAGDRGARANTSEILQTEEQRPAGEREVEAWAEE